MLWDALRPSVGWAGGLRWSVAPPQRPDDDWLRTRGQGARQNGPPRYWPSWNGC